MVKRGQPRMRELSFGDLRCHHFTGRSYIKSGEGRDRVYGYRTGIQCGLGDIEQSKWFRMVRELIDRKSEQLLYEQLLEYLTEHNYTKSTKAKLWRPLLNHIEFVKETSTMTTNTTNPFAGKTVVATGKLMNYTRDGIQNKLLSLGANPASSVTKKTDYLIVGEKAGSKLTKAQQLGVKTLTEEEFEQMLAD